MAEEQQQEIDELKKEMAEAMASPRIKQISEQLAEAGSSNSSTPSPATSSSRVHDGQGEGSFDPRAGLSKDQLEALEQLRKNIEPDLTPFQKVWCTDMCLLRYLRARQYDLPKAEKMLRDSLKWRVEFGTDTLTVDAMETQIRHGHMYTSTYDLTGRSTVFLRVHTKKDPHTKDQKLQFMVYSMERAIELMDESKGVEKMVWLVDCKGYNLQYNGEVKFGFELLNVLQNHFPERLGLVVILDPPFMFKGFWNVVYPFVDATTKKKFVMLDRSDKKTVEFLKQHFDLSKLERNFCGELNYEYAPDEYVAREREAEKQRKAKWESLGVAPPPPPASSSSA